MTDVKQAALQQALEAIEKFVASELTVGQRYTNSGQGLLDAIDAMRAALAAPQPLEHCPENEPECSMNASPVSPELDAEIDAALGITKGPAA